MKRSYRSHLGLASVCVLILMSLLPWTATAQSATRTTEVLGTILTVDAENSSLVVNAFGQEQLAPVAADVQVLNVEGQPLPNGLRAPELSGADVTLTLGQVNGSLVITVIRLGSHIPDQQTISGPSVGLKPLTELSATETYQGEDGGLYGGGRNEPPASHLAAARAATASITPLNAVGERASDGVIGFVSISMSNATMEFSLFKELADLDERKSGRVVIVDCAQGGQAMAQWVDPNAPAWIEADRRLEAAEISPEQVQVAWIKLANMMPIGDLDYHGRRLYDDTLVVLQNAKRRFPNLRIAYLGSRIYAGHADGPLNPEPYAYEGAFVVRWLIQDQIEDAAPLRYDGAAGSGQTPLLLWGPYLWADGTTPRRSDGLIWERADLAGDGVHPSESGRRKVADLLLDYFTTDRLAQSWFTNP